MEPSFVLRACWEMQMKRLKQLVAAAFEIFDKYDTLCASTKTCEGSLKSSLFGLLTFIGVLFDIKDLQSGCQTTLVTVDALCQAKFDETVCTSSAFEIVDRMLTLVNEGLVDFGKKLTEEQAKDKHSTGGELKIKRTILGDE